MYRIYAAIVLLSICACVQAQTSGVPGPAEGQSGSGLVEKCPDELAYTGEHENRFGFSVAIPEGLQGFWNSARCAKSTEGCACMGDHGRIIPLDKNATIEAFAAYNSLLHETAGDAVTEQIETIRKYAKPQSLKVIEKSQTKLDTVAAERVVVSYAEEKTGVVMIHDQITALRSVTKDAIPSHEYSISLVTPKADYGRHVFIFERVVRSWRMTPADR